jgi:hypothetical protein
VFAHNRLSSGLDSKKQFQNLASECVFYRTCRHHEVALTDFSSPLSKFDRPEGVSAMLGHLCVLRLLHSGNEVSDTPQRYGLYAHRAAHAVLHGRPGVGDE